MDNVTIRKWIDELKRESDSNLELLKELGLSSGKVIEEMNKRIIQLEEDNKILHRKLYGHINDLYAHKI